MRVIIGQQVRTKMQQAQEERLRYKTIIVECRVFQNCSHGGRRLANTGIAVRKNSSIQGVLHSRSHREIRLKPALSEIRLPFAPA